MVSEHPGSGLNPLIGSDRKGVLHLLQDIDSMVRTTMAIKMEVDDARNIRDTDVVKDKGNESQPSSSGSGKKHETSIP